MNLLMFAMEDKDFQNIHSWDELYHLMTIADKPVIISLKDDIKELPVMHNYKLGTLSILLSHTLTYNALNFQIQHLSHHTGFPGMVMPII
jgi:hypothetical protein